MRYSIWLSVLSAGSLVAGNATAQHVGDPRLDAEARAWEERIKGSPTIQKMQADIAALQGIANASPAPPAATSPPAFQETVYEGRLQSIAPARGNICTITLQDGRTFQVRSDAKIIYGGWKDPVTWAHFIGNNYFAGTTIRVTTSAEFYGAATKVEMNYDASRPKPLEVNAPATSQPSSAQVASPEYPNPIYHYIPPANIRLEQGAVVLDRHPSHVSYYGGVQMQPINQAMFGEGSVCGPNGCGPVSNGRRGLFKRRR